MVRRRLTTVDRLSDAVANGGRVRGIVQARRSVVLVRPRVDSPMETRVRLLLVLAGLPCPESGVEILDEYGQLIATADLQYPAERLAIEYDGELHHRQRRKWRLDISTRELLRDQGWEVVILTAEDIFRTPEHTLWRIYDRLAARGHPLLPAALDPQWEAHFPLRLDPRAA
jgi:hypothetical protein